MICSSSLTTHAFCHPAKRHLSSKILQCNHIEHQNIHKAVPMFRNCDYDIKSSAISAYDLILFENLISFQPKRAEREDFRRVKTRWKFQRVSRRKAIIMISVGFAGKNLINKIHVCEQFSIGKRVASNASGQRRGKEEKENFS